MTNNSSNPESLNPEKLQQQADSYLAIFESYREWLSSDPSKAISTSAIFIIAAVFFTIRKRMGDSLADIVGKTISLLNLFAVNYFSSLNFSLNYKKHITFDHRFFNVRGLRTQGTASLEVEKVYVNLKIAPSNNPNKPYSLVESEKERTLTGNRPIWDFLKQDLKVLAVIASAGYGKSTLLQHIALALAAGKHRLYGLPAYTPILLFLREHIDKIINDDINVAELTQEHFKNKNRYPLLNPPESWFAKQLEKGKAIVLLDGLDEVADMEKRKKVSAWVERQIVAYRNCPFIITSRPKGYEDAPLKQAYRLEIQPFSLQQVKEFADVWYLQNEILSSGKNDAGIKNKARLEAEDLLKRLRQMPILMDLTVNPLLLTMIAMVHRYRGQLPGRRVELYSEICDVLLAHWQTAKGLDSNLTAIQKRVALQPLAAAMMERNTREISTDDAIEIITEPLRQLGLTEQQAGKFFLRDIEASSGLLNEIENNKWGFAHLTFQEYLTACHWIEQKLELNWDDLINNTWWHETIRLYIAQADASKIISACLNINTTNALVLASECSDEAKTISESSLRESLQERLLTNLESDNRLVAPE